MGLQSRCQRVCQNLGISARLYGTSVNSVLRNPLRARVAHCVLSAAGVGGRNYIIGMTAGLVMTTAVNLVWITNDINKIESNFGKLR